MGRGDPVAGVLIVEDDYFVASELEAAFAEAGISVVGVANSADEALSIAAQKRPKIAVVDIRLVGERDGVDVAIKLRNEHGIPSIFASAHSDAKTQKRGQQAAPLSWVAKPYQPVKLVQLVRAHLKDS